MGNQESRVSSNYNIKNVVIENDYFSVLEAVSKKDNLETVSIFRYKNKLDLSEKQGETEDINATLFKNAVQRIKTIRHPGIVKFLNADIYSESPAIVTANVIPLKSVLNDVTPENLCTGIFNLLKTIEFLHQNCRLVYNNICLESIFVPKNNYTKWLIGEFQYSIPINAAKSESQKIIDVIPSRLQPSQDEKENNSFYRDYWLMGKLIEEIIEPYASKKGKGTINWIPLKQIALQMQDTIPQNRKSVTEVINEPFFNNNVIIEVLEILRNYKIKDENSKKQILSILPGKLKLMSNDIIEKNILPEIIQKEVINESFSDILFVELFRDPVQGNTLISEECYKNKIIPYILEMMKLRQWGTRIVLLKLIDSYYDAVIRYDTDDKNRDFIITEVLVGLEDMDSDIYLNSFSALTKILKKTKLKNDNANPVINEKNNDDVSSNVGSRRNSTINDKSQSLSSEKKDNSYLSVNVLINRFIIPHFIRMQISDNKEQKLESMRQVVELWKHYIRIEKDDLEVGQAAKSINANILKTMKFIVKLFKIDELSNIINDIFLKDILNNHNSFGYYYVSSYIMPLLVTHLPRTSMDLRNDEINILQTLLDYLSKCSQQYLIEEDTSSNVKKLKNMYTNKFQTLEKYHFVKAGPTRKAERSTSRTSFSTSNSSFDYSSRNNSRSDLSEISKKNSFDITPKRKNSNNITAGPTPIIKNDIQISSEKANELEWNNEIITTDKISDFENENENQNNFNMNIDNSSTISYSVPSPKKNIKSSISKNSWDNIGVQSDNATNSKTNDGWNFDWSDEENDNSMTLEKDKEFDVNVTSPAITKKKDEEVKQVNQMTNHKDTKEVKEKDKKEKEEEEEEEEEEIKAPIKKNVVPIATGAATAGIFNKSPMKMSSMKSMKLGHKKENQQSSLKKKLNDFNKMQQLKSQKKKEDNVKMKEIEDIMSLMSNDTPSKTPQKKTPVSSKSNSILSSNNSKNANKHKILDDLNSINREENNLINSGWDDLDDLDGTTTSNYNDGWNDIPQLNDNTTKKDSSKNEWEFNNDFSDISIPGMNNNNNNNNNNDINNNVNTDTKNEKLKDVNNAWDFNTDLDIPTFDKPKEHISNKTDKTNFNNAWGFNTDFDFPEMPEVNETKKVEDQSKIIDSWDFNNDFEIPEIKEDKKIQSLTKVADNINEQGNSWDFNNDFSIPEIKEDKKIEEPVIEPKQEVSNAWDLNDNFDIPESINKEKIDEPVVEESKKEVNVDEPLSAWDFNDDFDIPEVKKEEKVEETKKEENIIEPPNAWDLNDNFDIPEAKKENEVKETKNEDNNIQPSSAWDINDNFDIPEVKKEEDTGETKKEENIVEPPSAWDFNENFNIPEIKENEKKVEEPIVEEVPKNEEEKEKIEPSNSWDFNDNFDIPEINEETKVEEIPKKEEEKKVEKPIVEETPKEENKMVEERVVEEVPKEEEGENKKVEETVDEEVPKEEEEENKKVEETIVEEIPKKEEEKNKTVEETVVEEIPKEEVVNKKVEEVVIKETPKEEEEENKKVEEIVIEETPKEEEEENKKVEEIVIEETPKEEEEEENKKVEETVVEETPKEEEEENEKVEEIVVEETPKEEEQVNKIEKQSSSFDFKETISDINKFEKSKDRNLEKTESIIEGVMEATKINPLSDSESSVATESYEESRKKSLKINKNNVPIPEDAEIIEEVIEVVREVDEIDPNNPDLTETVEIVEELIEVKDGDENYEKFKSRSEVPSPAKDESKLISNIVDKSNENIITSNSWDYNDKLDLPDIPDLSESKESAITSKTEEEIQQEKENKLIDELKNSSQDMITSNSWYFDDNLELTEI